MSIQTTAKVKNLNVRTSEEQYNAIKQFAGFNGKSLSSFILDIILEKLEDWEDYQAIEDYEKNRINEPSVSWDSIQERAGLV